MRSARARLKETFGSWRDDKAPRLAASLAFYTMLSIAPLLIVTLKIVGALFGEQAAQVRANIGAQGAGAIQNMIAHAGQNGGGTIASIVSLVILLFPASGVFGELRDSMNTIWGVQPKPGRGIRGTIKDRFFSAWC